MIDQFSYDADMGVLHVKFHTGSIFSLRDVPPETAAEFAAAPSKGKFFHNSLKDRFQAL
jgi:hypothetical protein